MKTLLIPLLVLVLPASASAREATWKVTAKGTQVTTWHTETNGICGAKLCSAATGRRSSPTT